GMETADDLVTELEELGGAVHSPRGAVEVSRGEIGRGLESGTSIPIRLYMADPEHHERVEAALRALAYEFGLEIIYESTPEFHSYWREFFARFRRAGVDSSIVNQHMVELERLMRIQLINDIQPTDLEAEAKAVAQLITALDGTSDALIQLGPVFL